MNFRCLILFAALAAARLVAAPLAATHPATGISVSGATLNGMAAPGGNSSTAWFEWGTSIAFTQTTTPQSVGSGSGVVRVSASISGLAPRQIYHGRIVVSDGVVTNRGADQPFITEGKVIASGDNSVGQKDIPPGASNLVAVAAGASHSIGVRSSGQLLLWGSQSNAPSGVMNVVAVAAGSSHNVALRSNGTVAAWSPAASAATNPPAGLSNVIGIAAGEGHTLALKSDGSVVAWGNSTPGTVPPGLTNVLAIAAGRNHNVALRADGTVTAWGDSFAQTNVPGGLASVIAIASGWSHCLALQKNGTVIAWGDNSVGQINVPVGLSSVVAIGATRDQSTAVRSDGAIFTWGTLGFGANLLSNLVSVTAGSGHVLALGQNSPPTAQSQAPGGPGNRDLLVTLSGSDENGDALQLRVTTLPLVGTLYQYSGGGRGSAITSTNTLVTDVAGRVIFAPATNGHGNPYASFTFVVNDGETNSAPATVLLNISGAPFANVLPPLGVTRTNAILNGWATPNGFSTTAWFEWGTNLNYGSTTAPQSISSGINAIRITAVVSNLITRQIYHSRMVVSNGTSVTRSADQQFTTGAKIAGWGNNLDKQISFAGNITNLTSISGSERASLALRNDGKMLVQGSLPATALSAIGTVSNAIAASAGAEHILAMRADGRLIAAGNNDYGQTNLPAGLSNVATIAVGTYHNLALQTNGRIVAWGNNAYNQTNVPANLSNVVAVAAGAYHSIALRQNGTVLAWGNNGNQQTNVPAGLSNVVAIAGGRYHSMALVRNGTVAVWGYDAQGDMAAPADLTDAIAIAAGEYHCLALRSNGTVAAWGNRFQNAAGQTNVPPGLCEVTAIASGRSHSLALGNVPPVAVPDTFRGAANRDTMLTLRATDGNSDTLAFRITALPSAGMLFQFTNGARGPAISSPNTRVSDSSGRVLFAPIPATSGNPYASFDFVANDGETDSAPATVSIVIGLPFATTRPAARISENKAMLCGMATPSGRAATAWFEWGLVPNYTAVTAPVSIGSDGDVVNVTAVAVSLATNELYHCRLVVSNAAGVAIGTERLFVSGANVIAWGDNSFGQAHFTGDKGGVVSVAAGATHSVLLHADGSVEAWGDSSYGQTSVPPSLNNVVCLSARNLQTLALSSNGTVTAWGTSFDGTNYGPATTPAGLTEVIAIAAGKTHALALKRNGTVEAWGVYFKGSTYVPATVPPGWSNIVAVAAGGDYSLILRNDGRVLAWGDNSFGQTNVPLALNDVVDIAAGDAHCVAVRSDGTIVVWGANDNSQANVPASLTRPVAVAGGSSYSLGLKNDGTPVLWSFGPSGLPKTIYGVAGVAAGDSHCVAVGRVYDDFSGRWRLIGGQPTFASTTVGATDEPGEPLHGNGDAARRTIWFTWTAPASGGVVATVDSHLSAGLSNPMLAVYSGSSFNTLNNLGFNSTPLSKARVAFTATAGTAYQIAVDGLRDASNPSATGEGDFSLSLESSPPPPNDLFANATVIPNDFFEAEGSFLGSGREPGEPSHGTPAYPQTLWWRWTAPSSPGAGAIPVRLMTDATSHQPGLTVYTGGSVSALTVIPFQTMRTNGMTRIATFIVTPGGTYSIALSGYENDTNTALPVFGSFRLRLNYQPLALSIQTITRTTNALDSSVSVSANTRVDNSGTALSYPMRVLVSAISGASLRGDNTEPPPTNRFDQSAFPSVPFTVTPQGYVLTVITGLVSLPPIPSGALSASGYALFAELQEQPFGTNWFTVDQELVSFGVWPDLSTVPGPGGGVVRCDPCYVGRSGFNRLRSLNVIGPTVVPENSTANYFAQAIYSDNATFAFTNSTWTVTPSNRISITTNGFLRVSNITSDAVLTVGARYRSGGLFYDGALNVIANNTPISLTQYRVLTNGTFTFNMSGAPVQSYRFEATTNLTPPLNLWVALSNFVTPASGPFILNDPQRTNYPRRFYRVREL